MNGAFCVTGVICLSDKIVEYGDVCVKVIFVHSKLGELMISCLLLGSVCECHGKGCGEVSP